MTILFMSLKYTYNSNEENNTSFDQIGLQTAEILMLKTVTTMQVCYFTYVLVVFSIQISAFEVRFDQMRYYFIYYSCRHILGS